MNLKRNTILFLLFVTFSFAKAQTDIQYKITVAKDGLGDFTTIQSAIEATKAFPDQRITIFIKNGIYREKVRVPSWNNLLSFIGEDAEKTIITWDDYFSKVNKGRNSTFLTATLLVEADDFYTENLTIENSAGEVGQAVALHLEGNRCVFKNCKIRGNQDTAFLDGENSNQFFTGCTIEGTTDFIFGSATVAFSECEIISKKDSYITAASTTKDKPFGYVFTNCKLTANEGVSKVYLGRPWRNFAKTVFMNCELDNHILPEGWHNWNKTEAETTTFYAEYNNSGAGSATGNRVKWSHRLSEKEAKKYTPENILGEWVKPYISK